MTDADQGSATNRAVDFGYDSVYNRTLWTDTLGPTSVGYTDNALHQYTQVGSTTPTYDSNGNITSGYGGGLTLTYDCENRLTTAGSYSYGYDLLGRRLSRTYSTSTTLYVYDGPHIIAEYSGGSLIRKYIYGTGMDRPVAMIKVASGVESWYYYYTDALGSVRLLTNASGAVVEGYTYDPYGQPRVMYTLGSVSGAGPDDNWLTEDVTTYATSFLTRGNPIMFTGRWWDSTTKLYYYRFRDYSPTLGRFLQPDPAKYIDGMNLYAYCGNNPVNWIDPWGLERWGYHWWNLPVWLWIAGHNFGEKLADGIEGAYNMWEKSQNPPQVQLDKNGFPISNQDPRNKDVQEFKKDAFDAAQAIPNTSFSGPASTGALEDVGAEMVGQLSDQADENANCPGKSDPNK